jgi:acyl carrier protein
VERGHEERLEAILREVLNAEDLPTRDTSLKRRGLDSLALFTLIERLEQTFHIKVSEDEVLPRHFDTIDGLSAYIDAKMETGG